MIGLILRSRFRCRLAAAFLIIGFCTSAFSWAEAKTAAVKPKLNGYLIKHYSWLTGDVDIAVTPEFLCISSPTRSAVTVSRAPFKTVTAYDSAKKTYYETKPEAAGSFMIQRFLKVLGADPHPKDWKKVEEKAIAGVKAGRYIVDRKGAAPGKIPETGEKVLSAIRDSGFWVAEGLDIPAGAADIVLKMEGFPSIHKMPLYFQIPKQIPDKRARVSTYSVSKSSFPLAKFQVPSGYRKEAAEYTMVGDELELFGGAGPTGLDEKQDEKRSGKPK